ncbi:hypothetical protein RMCBS344292_04935 [Rhizopus microsporus]|nr:hypothetical protein RMCBS344292_04935 [Rhizopus microsporus]
MPTLNTHTVEGYPYLKKPTLLGDFSFYIKRQLVWPDVLRWKGSVFLPTLPGIAITTMFSCLVCLFNITFAVTISVPVSVLGTVSVALGLLLAFRVNTAYDRYWEGRKLVQTVMGTIRNVARQVWINIPEETDEDHLAKMRCIKLLLAFFVATKHHLRQEYGTDYHDLKELLPPHWEPASVAKLKRAGNGKRKSYGGITSNASHKDILLGEGDTSLRRRRISVNVLSKDPAISVNSKNSVKPTTHGEYMDSDEPTDIANIRRSLIQQEFPNSNLCHLTAAQLQRSLTGADASPNLSDEEEQREDVHLLDETVQSPSEVAGTDAPTCSSAPNGRGKSYFEDETNLINRFKQQHHRGIKRHLDHSKFTSPEDLPYQGDSDLSLPLEILFRIALFINQAKAEKRIDSSFVSVTVNSLDILANSLTAFERIVHTPIPKAYNIHLKQAVMLYIFFLPFALVESLGWLVAPIVALVSFTLFGIEAIGAEIENPYTVMS